MNDLTPDGTPDLPGPIGARHGETAAAPTRSGQEHAGQDCCPDARVERPSPAARLLMTTDPSTFATVLDTLTDWDA